MKSKKKIISNSYLKYHPMRNPEINWSKDDKNAVVLDVVNKGWANFLAQKLLNRPKISHIHLDKFGSFLWPLLDGKRSIKDLGFLVEKEFGAESYPLYERLASYFKTLESYKFIIWEEVSAKIQNKK